MKKKIHPGITPANEYLAVMLGACQTILYMGNNKLLQQAAVITTDYKAAPQEAAESVRPVPAWLQSREEAVKKFLLEIGDTIGELSNQYSLPVFVFGSASSITYFQKVNDYLTNNVRFFKGQYYDTNAADLASIAYCCTTQHC